MSRVILALRGVKAIRGQKAVLDIDRLNVNQGELVAVIGPNGAGKSTLLQVIDALLPRSGGSIEFYGRDVDSIDPIEMRRRCAMVFQEPLFIKDTVYANVALPLRLRGFMDIDGRVQEVLRTFRCDHLARRLAHRLSGGEAQRVCLARAFVTDPELLLLDEAFTALDSATRSDLLTELRQVALAAEKTVLLISHNLGDVLHFAQRAIAMEKGRILQDAAPETILRRPVTSSVARLVDMDNVIPCTVDGAPGGRLVRLPGGIHFSPAGPIPPDSKFCCLPGDAFALSGSVSDGSWIRVSAVTEQVIPGIGVYQVIVSARNIRLRMKLPREKACQLRIGEETTFFLNFGQAHLVAE